MSASTVSAHTGDVGFLRWIDEPDSDKAISFLSDESSEWRRLDYSTMASMVRRQASRMASMHAPGQSLLVVADDPLEQVVMFYGALYAGLRPCLIAPPGVLGRNYTEHLRAAAGTLAPEAIYVSDTLRVSVEDACALASVVVDVRATEDSSTEYMELSAARAVDHAAILQLTSGSSGVAKAVMLDLAGVDEHVDAILTWLEVNAEQDRAASWLPLHHDMGLIGMLVTGVAAGLELDIMTPVQFVRAPLRYLECFAARGATISAMPTFGLRHIVRRVRRARLDDFDFGSWRVLIVGSERVSADVLLAFEEHLGRNGLSDRTICPAYGMAEATLAVSGVPPTDRWSAVPASAVIDGEAGPVPGALGTAGGTASVVSCGLPVPGREVVVVDEKGCSVLDGVVGEIEVTGHSLGRRLSEGDRMSGEKFRTGDAGFVLNGQVYPLGRLGDATKSNGRTVFAEDVEERLVAEGIDPLRCCALLGYAAQGTLAVILLERPTPEWMAVAKRVAQSMFDGDEYRIVVAPGRSIVRTSSGKPRRRQLWSSYAHQSVEAGPSI
ncbi:MAG: hypothetical protein QOI95_51 [Acidimicrobiaceae bacterium]|jgi:acyl-CoA synthetase (AMP-forming)/AMP-acid ligase II